MRRILIVEDDQALSNGISLALRKQDVCVRSAYTLREAGEFIRKEEISLILLDMNLPDGNGMSFLKELRSWSQIPVIFLTANDMECEEVAGLEAGADDYITKPFSLAVLRARVQNIFRREEEEERNGFRSEEFSFDFDQIEFRARGKEIFLSCTEQKILRILIANRGHIVTRESLLDRVWGDEGEYVDENALSVAMRRLRSKLEEDPTRPRYIKTVYGQGYTWEENE